MQLLLVAQACKSTSMLKCSKSKRQCLHLKAHRAGVGIVQALQQRHQGGLATAGQPDERHQPPRLQRQAHLDACRRGCSQAQTVALSAQGSLKSSLVRDWQVGRGLVAIDSH